jgi:hypothetical protein
MSGSEIGKPALLAAIKSSQLKFEAIEALEARPRRYGDTAIITGRTRMKGQFENTRFGAHSRYTHVFFHEQGRWRLVSAQGTQVAAEAKGDRRGGPPASAGLESFDRAFHRRAFEEVRVERGP